MRFLSVEHLLPSRIVTNDEVLAEVRRASARHLSAAELDLVQRLLAGCFEACGTTVRYHRDAGETAFELAAEVGERAIERAGLDPSDIDLLLYTGVCRGVLEPASATAYQHRLGLRRATAFDVFDACASWARSLHLAHVLIRTGTYRTVMVLNAEFGGRESHRYELSSMDEYLHWHPSVTVGEAATATIIMSTPDDRDDEFEADFRTWGEKWDLCFVPLPNAGAYFGEKLLAEHEARPMQFVSYGLRLMEFATHKLVEHYRERPQFHRFAPDIVFGHSASDGMSRYVVDECGIDPRAYQFGHARTANTVSASVPVAMSEALRAGSLRDGDRVLLLLASSGVTTALTKFVYHA
jgi:3-oxoacyl-[acyl-carrier-protein] synthase III